MGCFLLGWNPSILQECGEASFRTLRKYVSAIIILSIIWGTIGYCFADRYIGLESVFAKLGAASVFIVIIICVERFIILTVGKLGMMGVFRFVLAMLMATLGATIFDQLIFRNDVEVKMKEIRTEQMNEEVARRLEVRDGEIAKLTMERDAMQHMSDSLYEEFSKKPVIVTTDVSNTNVSRGRDETGKPIVEHQTTVSKRNIANPIGTQAEACTKQAEKLTTQLADLQNKKLTMADDVRKEYEAAKVGFLEELHALTDIILGDRVALVFYIIMFGFLSMLELLVVTSKARDSHSDYDLIIEHQLNIKSATLRSTEESLLNR